VRNLRDKEEGEPTTKRDQALTPGMEEKILLLILLVPLVTSLVLRSLLVFNRWFDPDEYEHLHFGWMVMKGYLPYRDFFENHPPGLWYLLAPLAALFDESSAYLFGSRIVMCLLTLAIFFMVYKLTFTGQGYAVPLLSMVLLGVEVSFAWRTLEVRPDQVVILSWLLGAWLLVRSPEPIPRRAYGWSGLSAGMGLLFSPKALFALASLGGALLLLRPLAGSRVPEKKDIALFVGMSLVPLTCLLLLMWSRDEGWPFLLVKQVLLYSVAYPERFSGFRYFYTSLANAPVFWAFAAFGSLLAVRRFRRAESEREKRRLVIVAASTVGAALAHFVFIPAPYPQSLLPFITFLAVFGGECGGWIGESLLDLREYGKRRVLAIGLVVVLLVGSFHAFASNAYHLKPLTRTNREYVEWLMSVLQVTARSDAILDGYAAYIFRPQASFYGWLGMGLIKEINSGVIKYDIPERCGAGGCPVIVLDRRLLQVAPWMNEFVQANYRPSSVQRVYLRRGIGNRDKGAPDQ
jgi:hypothetical protein